MKTRDAQLEIVFLTAAMLAVSFTGLLAGTTESTIRDSDDPWTIPDKASMAPAPAWIETFDTYRTGTQLHGVNGWKGWGNDPGGGAFTSSTQQHSKSNSVDVAGTTDLIREFSGFDSGSWTFAVWQYVPSSKTGTTYFIMLNQYDDLGANLNWSVQVTFDLTSGMVTNTGVSGSNPISILVDQWVEIRVVIDLATDTQAFFYGGQKLYAGTWSGQVSGGGIAEIGAVSLFANGSSSVFYDDFTLTTNLLFEDDFESGNTGAWSATAP